MVYLLKQRICVYLSANFQVSSVVLTSFRQEWGYFYQNYFLPPQMKPLKNPPRLGLRLPITFYSCSLNDNVLSLLPLNSYTVKPL